MPENASMDRAYWPHRWSASGSTPITRYQAFSTRRCLGDMKMRAM